MSMFMNNDLRKVVQESEQVLNEVYFGETSDIQKLQTLITKIRKNLTVMNVPSANSMDEVLKFNREVERIFGFRGFALNILPDRTFNAYTLPVSNRIDSLNPGKKLQVTNKGFKFKDNNIYVVYTYITSGLLLRKKEFTDREILAIILHEIGHSFTSAYTDNTILGVGFKIIILAKHIERIIIDLILGGKLDVSIFGALMATSNVAMFIVSPIDKAIRSNKTVSTILGSLDFGLKFIGNVFNEIMMAVVNFNNTMAVFVPHLIITSAIQRIIKNGPINSLAATFSFRDEQLSDNFATAYGYGGDLSSALSKMNYSDKGLIVNKIHRSVPVFQQLSDISLSISQFLLHPLSSHPQTVARIMNQIDMLEYELKHNKNLDKKAAAAIKDDLKDLKKILKEHADNKADYETDPDAVAKAYSYWMADKFGGDFRNKYFDFIGKQSYKHMDAGAAKKMK